MITRDLDLDTGASAVGDLLVDGGGAGGGWGWGWGALLALRDIDRTCSVRITLAVRWLRVMPRRQQRAGHEGGRLARDRLRRTCCEEAQQPHRR